MGVLSCALDIFVLLMAHGCLLTRGQSQGDIRLVGGESKNLGRVEVFFRAKWSTICDRNYVGSADTVCYQLNRTYSSQVHPGTSVRLMNESLKKAKMPQIDNNVTSNTPIAFMDLDCGAIYSRPLVTTHVLQCDYKILESGSECTHDDDLAVLCDTQPEKPYNSEVRLVGGDFSSSGTLEVYLKGKWGNVCHNGFQQIAADTACRQLGYTNAQRILQTHNNTAGLVWLKDLSCKKPQSCLNGCFGKNKFDATSCPDGTYVGVQCNFQPGMKGRRGFFGNPVMCSLQHRYTKTPAYFVAILSVSSFFWIVASTAIIVTAVCCSVKRCPCYRFRERKNRYTSMG